MMVIRVKRLHESATLPKYAHTGTYGDLAADLSSVEEIAFTPGEIKKQFQLESLLNSHQATVESLLIDRD